MNIIFPKFLAITLTFFFIFTSLVDDADAFGRRSRRRRRNRSHSTSSSTSSNQHQVTSPTTLNCPEAIPAPKVQAKMDTRAQGWNALKSAGFDARHSNRQFNPLLKFQSSRIELGVIPVCDYEHGVNLYVDIDIQKIKCTVSNRTITCRNK
ncbi:MAG: hypothetical protein H8D23_27065 [Candidatus Brocadiales bacterium]|nr:hypothetical protein [Candidatus Brocadiales bacterium]